MSEIDPAPEDVTPEMAAVAAVVGAPDFIAPWLDRFYDEQDAELILAAGAAGRRTAMPQPPATAPQLWPTSTRRGSSARSAARSDRDESGAYAATNFHERLEIWAMFEGWKDVPLAVHRQLADWDVDSYAQKIRADVEATRDGHPGDSYAARYSYVLLHEAEAIVAAQDHVYLWPCDCRAIVGKCRKTRDVCLRFENDRGLGGNLQGARRRGAAFHRQGRPDAHVRPAGRPRRQLVRLQLLHRLLLPATRRRAPGRHRRVARAAVRRRHRHGPLQGLRPLRPALPLRGHRMQY